jgi:hypothetical protein
MNFCLTLCSAIAPPISWELVGSSLAEQGPSSFGERVITCSCCCGVFWLAVGLPIWNTFPLTCANCGSRARRRQWKNRGGCPTCGSDLTA